jgi:hypothetical protein
MTHGYPGVRPEPSAADRVAVQASRYREARDLEAPRLVAGKPYDQWSEDERRSAWLWNLGQRFRTPGMKPPPVPEYAVPPIPGSESDTERSHQGSMAGR